MFLQRLLNQTNAPELEQLLQFTSARHKLIAANIANIDTPGYQQADMDLDKFQGMLRSSISVRDAGHPEAGSFENIKVAVEHPTTGMLSHDGNNRTMEQLASEQAKNGMLHNMVIELLRKQYAQLDMALKERVS